MSQRISTIATEYLYRDLVIPYLEIDQEWIRLKQVLDSEGLQHVRTVNLGFNKYTRYKLCTAVDALIFRLPDSLQSFRYGSMCKPSDEGLRHLWQTQSNLTNIQATIVDLVSSYMDIRSLRSVTELQIDLDSESISYMKWPHHLLDSIGTMGIQKLILSTPEPLTDHILSNILPNSLTHINFSHTACNHVRLDDYPSLRHLELHECFRLDPVLDHYLRPALSTLIIELTGDPADRDFNAIQNFLCRFNSLKRLILEAGWQDFRANIFADSIANHSQNLEDLYLDVSFNDRPLTETPLRCPHLSQLFTGAIPINMKKELLLEHCKVCLIVSSPVPEHSCSKLNELLCMYWSDQAHSFTWCRYMSPPCLG